MTNQPKSRLEKFQILTFRLCFFIRSKWFPICFLLKQWRQKTFTDIFHVLRFPILCYKSNETLTKYEWMSQKVWYYVKQVIPLFTFSTLSHKYANTLDSIISKAKHFLFWKFFTVEKIQFDSPFMLQYL